jgi:D-alanyl-D-alanine carboxypeptidase
MARWAAGSSRSSPPSSPPRSRRAAASARLDATPRALAKALAVPHVAKAATGAVAVDLGTGQTVFSLHPDLSLRPASNEKLAVTYAALVKLGPGFQLETDVIGNGDLEGDGGPATSSSRATATRPSPRRPRAAGRQVRDQGIRRVSGRIVADESFFDARRTARAGSRRTTSRSRRRSPALVVDRPASGATRRATRRSPAATAFRTLLRNAASPCRAPSCAAAAPTTT